jgi:hypothetical protein
MLSANIEHDNTPWPLPDGRLLYMRWEYVDRSQVNFHHLWTMIRRDPAQRFVGILIRGLFIEGSPFRTVQ